MTVAPAPTPPASLGRIQRADVIGDQIVLELFTGERSWMGLQASLEEPSRKLGARPQRDDPTPPASQKLLRAEAVPASLLQLDWDAAAGLLQAHLELKGGKKRLIVVEADPADPRILLCAIKDKGARILGVLVGGKRPIDGRDVRKGRLYESPRQPPASAAVETQAAPTEAGPRPSSPAASQLRAAVRKERKRLKRLIGKLQQDLVKHGDAAALAAQGEALKTVLHQHQRGMTSLPATSTTGEPITIALDPLKSATDNLEALFRRARRARRAAEEVRPRLLEVQSRLERLEALLAAALGTSPADGPPGTDADAATADLERALAERSSGAGLRARPAARKGPRVAFRLFQCTGDVPVRVGRSARDSDELTFHLARGNDTWMHCRDVHGAHVVVPVPIDDLPAELLIDAAHLAAHFSNRRGEPRADVQYTAKKHVRKPGRGAAAGAVHLSFEKVLHLVVDDGRLKRLLASEEQG